MAVADCEMAFPDIMGSQRTLSKSAIGNNYAPKSAADPELVASVLAHHIDSETYRH